MRLTVANVMREVLVVPESKPVIDLSGRIQET